MLDVVVFVAFEACETRARRSCPYICARPSAYTARRFWADHGVRRAPRPTLPGAATVPGLHNRRRPRGRRRTRGSALGLHDVLPSGISSVLAEPEHGGRVRVRGAEHQLAGLEVGQSLFQTRPHFVGKALANGHQIARDQHGLIERLSRRRETLALMPSP